MKNNWKTETRLSIIIRGSLHGSKDGAYFSAARKVMGNDGDLNVTLEDILKLSETSDVEMVMDKIVVTKDSSRRTTEESFESP